jgi:hypothetical protein
MSIAVTIAMVSVGFVGIKTFNQTIYKSRSCTWANIDNIELRTLTDIPNTNECKCTYSAPAAVKKSAFKLELSAVEIKEYAVENKFVVVNKPDGGLIQKFEEVGVDAEALAKGEILQKAADRPGQESFTLVLHPESKTLLVYLKYYS